MKEILRDNINLDTYTIVILITVLLQLLLKYIYPIEYKNFIRNNPVKSINTTFIYLFTSICFSLIIAVMIYPFVNKQLSFYFDNTTLSISIMFLIILFAISIKTLLKGMWFLVYSTSDNFINYISKKSYVTFCKYILILLASILYLYSPLKDYISTYLLLIIITIIITLDWVFELLYNLKFKLESYIYKILYLCTLEILPFLVFTKLIF